MNDNLDISKLNKQQKLVMFEISRIQKSSTACFSQFKLEKKHKIKEEHIDLNSLMKNLMNMGLICKGNKKDVWCVTHYGKLMEHAIEIYFLEKGLYRVTRNKNDL